MAPPEGVFMGMTGTAVIEIKAFDHAHFFPSRLVFYNFFLLQCAQSFFPNCSEDFLTCMLHRRGVAFSCAFSADERRHKWMCWQVVFSTLPVALLRSGEGRLNGDSILRTRPSDRIMDFDGASHLRHPLY